MILFSRKPVQTLALILLGYLSPSFSFADVPQILQLVDYIGVDYAAAVDRGEIINPAEYAEMQEFSATVTSQMANLGEPNHSQPGKDESGITSKEALAALAEQLASAIKNKAAAKDVTSITRKLREQLMANYPVALLPTRVPDLQTGEKLYQTNCAVCHGASAEGNGPAAATLDPTPTNFMDPVRARQRSLFGLFNTITLGVSGTGMTGFSQLTDSDRWDLAFYVGSQYVKPEDGDKAEASWKNQSLSLTDIVVSSPAELDQHLSNGELVSSWVRTHPELLFENRTNPISIALKKLRESKQAYEAKDFSLAKTHALSAYLDGFELVEASLGNISKPLVLEIEQAMLSYRLGLSANITEETLSARYADAIKLLESADELLTTTTLSPSVAFTSSLIILLREGLEAILILAAMITILSKTGRIEGLKYLHAGWILALAAGLATWGLSSYLIEITGATREITEGATALVAAAILLYVGFWMHGNANAKEWGHYLQEKMHDAMGRKTLWTLALVSFLAVYREAFETVLFYEALWVQAGPDAHSAITAGGLAATALLLLLVWLMIRFGLRVPLKQFFSVSAILMVVLAIIFVGQGVAALQEAGRLSVYPLPLPRIELLGIYPNAEGISLQAIIAVLSVSLFIYQRRSAEPNPPG